MIKKILGILTVLALAAYLVFSVVAMTDRHEDTILCGGVDLVVVDSLSYDLVDYDMIMTLLRENSLDPIGRPLESVNTDAVRSLLTDHPLIGSAVCYKTGGGNLKIIVSCKVPLVRVRNNRGQDFYVDSRGGIMSQHALAVQVPVATGYIDRDYASDKLLSVVKVIDQSEFWRAQIEQINVTKDGRVELVPRVGNHLLLLGTPDDIENKLDRLMNFYRNGLDNVGWNKYRTISVAYENQVVCKKRK